MHAKMKGCRPAGERCKPCLLRPYAESSDDWHAAECFELCWQKAYAEAGVTDFQVTPAFVVRAAYRTCCVNTVVHQRT
eukprot:355528-Chlamydomonas_euryale.AAC.2